MGITGGMMMVSMAGSYNQGQAQRQQGKHQQQVLEQNSRLAQLQAEDSIRRGDKEAAQVRKQASKIEGAQRAALAAQGLDVDMGSALDIQMETAELGALDALTVKNNAWREAWGYKTQAIDLSTQGRMANIGSKAARQQTLLTGGLQAAQIGMTGYARSNSGGGS